MGVTSDGFDRVIVKLEHFFDDTASDLKEVGTISATGIVQATLAGLGPDDEPFAAYSASYQALIDSVGGKPQQTVNLRGIFLKDGARNPKFRSAERRRLSGADRGSYVTVSIGGRTFQAKTPITRPAMGLTDPQSEMSLDLIQIDATDTNLKLVYNPRENQYMLYHQTGTDKLPQREWFTLKRSSVQAAIHNILVTLFNARVQRFNNASIP